MSTIVDALTWHGSGATLSLFAVYLGGVPRGDPDFVGLPEFQLREYLLDDDLGLFPGLSVVEYDLVFETLPSNLSGCLSALLVWARGGGAVVAWFGFEGSFHFEHILTEDISDQVFALADAEGIAVARDADLPSMSWRQRVVRAGARLREARRE